MVLCVCADFRFFLFMWHVERWNVERWLEWGCGKMVGVGCGEMVGVGCGEMVGVGSALFYASLLNAHLVLFNPFPPLFVVCPSQKNEKITANIRRNQPAK